MTMTRTQIDSGDSHDPHEYGASGEEDPLTECLQTNSRCYVHSMQLVVKDGLKEASPHLKNAFQKFPTL